MFGTNPSRLPGRPFDNIELKRDRCLQLLTRVKMVTKSSRQVTENTESEVLEFVSIVKKKLNVFSEPTLNNLMSDLEKNLEEIERWSVADEKSAKKILESLKYYSAIENQA